ncbi:MAG: hypothetical protein DMG32_27585 [Acidobacteria bacterium]|nr:MAG: hypothetical protein DMG32_27585 [Acidobacteriota bacterium]
MGANTILYGVRLTANLYQSRVSAKDAVGYAFSADRTLGRRLDAGFDFYKSKSQGDFANQSMSAHLREVITQSFSLTEYVTRSGGQTAFNLGGELRLSNRFSISLSHETAYLPFRVTTGGGPFTHVYNLRLQFCPFGNLQLAASTNVAPDGTIRYTTSAGDYLYRSSGLQSNGMLSLKIAKYVVLGKVVDGAGAALAGVALQVDGQMVFSDSHGEFLVRFPKRKKVNFKISLDDFLTATPYTIVTAPTSAAEQVLPLLSRGSDASMTARVATKFLFFA